MGKDYYATLKVQRGASKEEIQAGFKQSVLRWHQNLTKADKEAASENFNKACEAYEVLSNDISRSVYDMFGYESLITGITLSNNIVFPAYQYSSNPTKIYEQFILDSSPYARIIDFDGSACQGSIFGKAALGLNWEKDCTPIDAHLSVQCSLEELYNGCLRTVVYKRRVFNEDRRTTREVEEKKEVIVKPGMKNGDTIKVFEGGSDQMGRARGNLIVTVEEIPHHKFTRKLNDLFVTVKMDLMDTLDAKFVKILSLDGRKLKVSFDQAVSPSLVITIKGEGMPVADTNTKGNMHVGFEVALPEGLLPPGANETIKSCLPS